MSSPNCYGDVPFVFGDVPVRPFTPINEEN